MSKKILISAILLILSLILYPIIHNSEVPLAIKILDLRYTFHQLYSGASSSSTFSRSASNQFLDYFHSPVSHSSDIIIDRFSIPSLIDNHQISVNVYVNKSFFSNSSNKLPTVIYIHGGGWIFAPKENLFYERFTQKGLAFIEIRYRLAPENKFPIPLEDCYSAILNQTIYKYTNMEKIALLGDSAGANLVAALLYLLRDRGNEFLKMIKYQFLVYPATGTLDKFPSQEKYKDWYILGEANMKYYTISYARNESSFQNTYFNILKEKNLKGLPESYFILSERDYLFSEGEEYAKLVREGAEKETTVKKYNIEHSFFKMNLEESKQAFEDMIQFMKEKKFL